MIRPDPHQRIVDTVEICYREAGEVFFDKRGVADPATLHFSEKFACKVCGQTAPILSPRCSASTTRLGACPVCQGFGNTIDYDLDLIIPDPTFPSRRARSTLGPSRNIAGTTTKISAESSRQSAAERSVCRSERGREGIRPQTHVLRFFEEVEKKKYKVHVRVFMSRYRGYTECPDCRGARLRPEALWVRLGDLQHRGSVARMNIARAQRIFRHAAAQSGRSGHCRRGCWTRFGSAASF